MRLELLVSTREQAGFSDLVFWHGRNVEILVRISIVCKFNPEHGLICSVSAFMVGG